MNSVQVLSFIYSVFFLSCIGSATFAGTESPFCEADWSPLVGQAGVGVGGESSSDTVSASVLYDDGSGPALHVAGRFWTAGGQIVNSIAKWTGSNWEPLAGPNGVGLLNLNANGIGRVRALSVYDDGRGPALYVGGQFDTAGGYPANHIARWDGHDWEPLNGAAGNGVWGNMSSGSTTVHAMTVYDDGSGPALFVGGRFLYAGGLSVKRIAKWDGAHWDALAGDLGEGLNGEVSSLLVHNQFGASELYVGGRFTTAGGHTANRIARWDGAVWGTFESDSYGTGVSWALGIEDMTIYQGQVHIALYIVGSNTQHVIRWDDNDWLELSGPNPDLGVDNNVYALETGTWQGDPVLFAGGSFIRAGGLEVRRITFWNGEQWHPLEGTGEPGTLSGSVGTLIQLPGDQGPVLFAGGNFSSMGGVHVNHIAAWGCLSSTCPEDVTRDGEIDLADLNLVLAGFGQTTPQGDTNGDGFVDLADLNAILAAFGTVCD